MGKFDRKIKRSKIAQESALVYKPLLSKKEDAELERIIQLRANRIVSEFLKEKKKEIEAYAIEQTFMTVNALYSISLNSLHGFGKDRLNKLIDKVRNQFVCLQEGYLTAIDVRDWCQEKGIEFKNIYTEEVVSDEA